MKFLIDTHILIWCLLDPDRLTPFERKWITDTEHQVMVSAVSFWEISIKYSLKKFTLEGVKPEDLPEHAIRMGLETLSISSREAASFYRLPKRGHKDPFDRMLIWQAISHQIPVLSRDQSFQDYRDCGLSLVES